MSVFEDMFQQIKHRICLTHLYANFKKKFGGGVLVRYLLMGTTKATYFQAWEKKDEWAKATRQEIMVLAYGSTYQAMV